MNNSGKLKSVFKLISCEAYQCVYGFTNYLIGLYLHVFYI